MTDATPTAAPPLASPNAPQASAADEALAPIPKPYRCSQAQQSDSARGDGLRMELVQPAIAFLSSPATSNAPLSERLAFLRSKGFTDAEVDYAFSHIPHQGQYGAGLMDGSGCTMDEYVPRWVFWASLFMGGIGVASCWFQQAQIKASALEIYETIRSHFSALPPGSDEDEEEVLEREVKELRDELEDVKMEMHEVKQQMAFLATRLYTTPAYNPFTITSTEPVESDGEEEAMLTPVSLFDGSSAGCSLGMHEACKDAC